MLDGRDRPRKKNHILPRPYKKVGQYFKELRKKAGYTQREIGILLGYPEKQIISNIECGLDKVPNHKLRLLIKHLPVDPEFYIALVIKAERAQILKDLFEDSKSIGTKNGKNKASFANL